METKEIVKLLKITKYKVAICMWGIIPLLEVLCEYEQLGYFEECHCIKLAIDNVNEFWNDSSEKLPTRIYPEIFSDYKIRILEEHGFSGDISIANIPQYIGHIKRYAVIGKLIKIDIVDNFTSEMLDDFISKKDYHS